LLRKAVTLEKGLAACVGEQLAGVAVVSVWGCEQCRRQRKGGSACAVFWAWRRDRAWPD
jgi:hypothetical protein